MERQLRIGRAPGTKSSCPALAGHTGLSLGLSDTPAVPDFSCPCHYQLLPCLVIQVINNLFFIIHWMWVPILSPIGSTKEAHQAGINLGINSSFINSKLLPKEVVVCVQCVHSRGRCGV